MSSPQAYNRFSAWLGRKDGVAAVEFALLLPLLLVLMFGVFEMGRLFFTYHIVSASVRDAARYAALLPVNCSVPVGGSGPTGFSAANLTRIRNLAVSGDIAGGAALVPGWDPTSTEVQIAVDCVDNVDGTANIFEGRYGNFDEIPTVTVTGVVPFSNLFGGLIPLNLSQVTVSHSQTWTG